jgi:iron complex transport system ATP-binding protein
MTAANGVVWSLSGVAFRYQGATRPTLDNITLDIGAGQMTAVLGPNGAGKSTLLSLLLGTISPDAGTVGFQNRALGEWSRRELAREIGVVPQGEAEPLFSAREIVAMGRYPYLGPWQRERAEDATAIRRAMDRCDVAEFSDRWLSTLSGGERQRVRLARALAQEPSVLVLDEPTAFLDIRHEMTTFALLRDFRDAGTTVVLATHNLNLAARYADALVLMRDGRVVASGKPGEVLTAERVATVYDWPVAVVSHADGAPQIVPDDRPATGGRRPATDDR